MKPQYANQITIALKKQHQPKKLYRNHRAKKRIHQIYYYDPDERHVFMNELIGMWKKQEAKRPNSL